MEILHEVSYSSYQRRSYGEAIFRTIHEAMHNLLEKMENL